MKKHMRKIVSAVALCLSFSIISPSAHTALAATKTFTYAEQKTGSKVTSLGMEVGEKVDLKFEGVSNWKTYTYKWVSSNTKTATVDSNGLITAKANGTAKITLIVSGGDGTQYTSTGVDVTVGKVTQDIAIGTSTENELEYATVEMGESLSLRATGISKGYTCNWSSTNEHIAKIDNNGKVTSVTTGLTVIQLNATNSKTGEKLYAVPIALQVMEKGSAKSEETTPIPTSAPTNSTEDSYSTDLNYENLARYPEEYKDRRIVFDGKVTQVMSADYFGEVTARMNVNNDSDQNLLFVFDKDIIDYNLLVGDEITVHGVFTGLYSYTTVLGSELTVPRIKVNKIEIKEKPKEVIPTEDDIEIVKEYVMHGSWYTYHFMVIRNNSKATVELSTSTMAYSKDGKVLGLSEKSEEAIGSGCEVLIYETFDKNSEIHSFSTEFDVSKENYYLSVIQDLSYEEITIDDGAIFKVTNNGGKPAEFVQGYALFIKDGIVVDYESAYFTDNDSEIKPGKSVSKQLETNEEFDTIEFYLSGRADD